MSEFRIDFSKPTRSLLDAGRDPPPGYTYRLFVTKEDSEPVRPAPDGYQSPISSSPTNPRGRQPHNLSVHRPPSNHPLSRGLPLHRPKAIEPLTQMTSSLTIQAARPWQAACPALRYGHANASPTPYTTHRRDRRLSGNHGANGRPILRNPLQAASGKLQREDTAIAISSLERKRGKDQLPNRCLICHPPGNPGVRPRRRRNARHLPP